MFFQDKPTNVYTAILLLRSQQLNNFIKFSSSLHRCIEVLDTPGKILLNLLRERERGGRGKGVLAQIASNPDLCKIYNDVKILHCQIDLDFFV
jgi:hypothetical protein